VGILIFKGLTARRLNKLFGVKGLKQGTYSAVLLCFSETNSLLLSFNSITQLDVIYKKVFCSENLSNSCSVQWRVLHVGRRCNKTEPTSKTIFLDKFVKALFFKASLTLKAMQCR
jgi:hypothetical protein